MPTHYDLDSYCLYCTPSNY